ncbi:zinc transporter ZIP4 isoform X1 [Alosa sapidissima]|uniref:zinc transporter ZIP4 isoform X1 n=2 Tax=Alosa sapidissima TaxID=34773 RepID=UPI001C09AD87|nr:zinc transporter ZIP4 isoform X1 [Alosa sapidissima]
MDRSNIRFCVFLICFSLTLLNYAKCSNEDIFDKVVALVSPGEVHLTEKSLHSILTELEKRVQCSDVSCGKCLSVDHVPQLVTNYSTTQEVHADDFLRLAAGCCLYLSDPLRACGAATAGRWGEETEEFIHQLAHGEDAGHGGHEDHGGHEGGAVERLLHSMEEHYRPESNQPCVTMSDILEESNASMSHDHHSNHSDHDGDHRSGEHHEHSELDTLCGVVLYHALRGDCMTTQELPEEAFFLDFIFGKFGSDNVTLQDLESLMKSLNLGERQLAKDHDHGHDHHDAELHDQAGHRAAQGQASPRHSHEEGQERNSSWEQSCYSAGELMRIHHLNGSNLTRDQFVRLSPALVQQLVSGACNATEPTVIHPGDGLSRTEKYVYATVANLLICLTALFGIVVLLCTSCSSIFQLCIQFCISLAVGSLTGDALLHLLPMFLGLHAHGTGENGGGHDLTYIYKMLVLLAGIYYFYLMEAIFAILSRRNKHHHHPHHHGEDSEPHHCDHGRVIQMYQQEKKHRHSTSQADLVEEEDNEKSFPQEQPRTQEQKMLPYMITIGDGIHNFADGLAIGAAFSISWKSGLATSLAVLCHELPHELGDFAILLHCGLSVKKALLLNMGSAMTSFIGLYISLSIATDAATKEWIAAVTAGLFLYVGLADMLPSMVHVNSSRPWFMFVLQNLGLLTGWGILLVLSLYEDQIGVF